MQQLTAPAAPPIWTNGRFTVEIQTPRANVYRVVTRHARPGGADIDTLTVPAPDLTLARAIARVIALSLKHAAPTINAAKAVDNARRAVLHNLDGQLAFVLASPTVESTRTGEVLQDVRAMFVSAEDEAADDVLAADINATLDASSARPVADEATAYLAGLAAERQARIEAAVAAADAKPTLADVARNLGGNPARVNRPRLATNTPSARKLTRPMLDMLAQAAANGGHIRLDRRDGRNRARAILKRGEHLTLIYATPGVEASLYAAEITDLGRRTVAEHRNTEEVAA